MKWTTFSPGEEPIVLTTDLCSIYACARCPGHARVWDLPGGVMCETGETPHDPDALVFYTHGCHRVSETELEELESRGMGTTVTSPHCGTVIQVPGFLDVELYVCGGCGKPVQVPPPTVQ